MKHDIKQFEASQLKELPAPLPDGERVIWQGRPTVKGLALRAFHVREVPLYFGAFLVWRLWSNWSVGAPLADIVWTITATVVPAVISVAVLTGLAWLFARACCYTITSKRVLLQFGVALPMTMNIPLSKITGAAVKIYRDGTGDIPLALADKERVSHLLLWPHVRPWKLIVSQPMLRSVPDAAAVAAKMQEALTGQPSPQVAATPSAAAYEAGSDYISRDPTSVAA
ncbi:MAG: PH domain-containing protein [Bradyrhizobiaceae bacterium]|nr:MAG: PH domain-containing protein [Bradyrhizobiaceae bacterium]